MTIKQIIKAGCAAFFSCALAGAALGENARLPYHQLYAAQKAQTALNQIHTNLLVILTLQSARPGIKTSDLSVYIDSKAGKIPVPIGSVGNFFVPLRDDLLAEDPWIIVNQPRGTMALDWRVGMIAGRLTRAMRYTRLMEPVRESGEVQEQMRRFFPSPKLTMTGLKLSFPPTSKTPSITIHAKAGDRKLAPDVHGEITIPLAAEWLKEDPEITLTDLPATLEIISQNNPPAQ
jgi:hypothetical protein